MISNFHFVTLTAIDHLTLKKFVVTVHVQWEGHLNPDTYFLFSNSETVGDEIFLTLDKSGQGSVEISHQF